MKSFFKNKNNVIIGLCAVVVLMGIGFAAFSQRLEIGDTTVTNSDWNVYIKSAVAGTPVGDATGSAQVVDRASAKLTANLSSPGDSVTYTITVANDGNIDAVLDVITLSASNSDSVIKYSYYGIVEDEELLAESEKSFTVTIEYDSTKTGTVTDAQKRNTLTLDLDFVQKTSGGGSSESETESTTSVVYSRGLYDLGIGDSIEGKATTTNPSTLGCSYYLKLEVENNLITAAYVCFVTDTEYCMKGGDASAYQSNVAILRANETWFNNDNGRCDFNDSSAFCQSSATSVRADSDGYVSVDVAADICEVYSDGSLYCLASGADDY